jgi:hypothetical protein
VISNIVQQSSNAINVAIRQTQPLGEALQKSAILIDIHSQDGTIYPLTGTVAIPVGKIRSVLWSKSWPVLINPRPRDFPPNE